MSTSMETSKFKNWIGQDGDTGRHFSTIVEEGKHPTIWPKEYIGGYVFFNHNLTILMTKKPNWIQRRVQQWLYPCKWVDF